MTNDTNTMTSGLYPKPEDINALSTNLFKVPITNLLMVPPVGLTDPKKPTGERGQIWQTRMRMQGGHQQC